MGEEDSWMRGKEHGRRSMRSKVERARRELRKESEEGPYPEWRHWIC